MKDDSTYQVIVTGKLKTGASEEQVRQALARLFKMNPDKAASIMQSQRVIKKGLQHKDAYLYKKRLEDIGLIVELRRESKSNVNQAVQLKVETPPATPSSKSTGSGLDSLSLEPMQEKKPSLALALEPMDDRAADTDSATASPADADSSAVICPKCGAQQTQRFQCTNCGVYISKFLKNSEGEEENINSGKESSKPGANIAESEDDELPQDSLTIKTIAIGVAVAFAGAMLWRFIAVTFDYELGLIAWAIGGAIGYAVAFSGSQGEKTAILCGALALASIIGGKYLAMSAFQQEWTALMDVSMNRDVYMAAYEEEKEIARVYVDEVNSEETLKAFMVEFGYSESSRTDGVTQEELENFQNFADPRLRGLAANTMNVEDWLASTKQSFENVSTWDLMKESFGFLDIVFLFLGIGTAFQLGRGHLAGIR